MSVHASTTHPSSRANYSLLAFHHIKKTTAPQTALHSLLARLACYKVATLQMHKYRVRNYTLFFN